MRYSSSSASRSPCWPRSTSSRTRSVESRGGVRSAAVPIPAPCFREPASANSRGRRAQPAAKPTRAARSFRLESATAETTTWSGPSSVARATTRSRSPASADSSSSADWASTKLPTTWPPTKPTSIRTRSSGSGDHLREDAVHGVGVDEGHLQPEHAPAGRRVDQLRSRLGELGERRVDVADLVGHVVHSRSPPGEEPTHGGVLAQRTEQLEPALPDTDAGRLDPLLLDPGAVLEPRPEQALVRRERRVEIVHGHPQVVDRARRLHAAIVCERLEPAMRVFVPALLLAVAVLAGCGGSRHSSKPNGEASKPQAQV